jgi:hypothetical protein
MHRPDGIATQILDRHKRNVEIQSERATRITTIHDSELMTSTSQRPRSATPDNISRARLGQAGVSGGGNISVRPGSTMAHDKGVVDALMQCATFGSLPVDAVRRYAHSSPGDATQSERCGICLLLSIQKRKDWALTKSPTLHAGCPCRADVSRFSPGRRSPRPETCTVQCLSSSRARSTSHSLLPLHPPPTAPVRFQAAAATTEVGKMGTEMSESQWL